MLDKRYALEAWLDQAECLEGGVSLKLAPLVKVRDALTGRRRALNAVLSVERFDDEGKRRGHHPQVWRNHDAPIVGCIAVFGGLMMREFSWPR